MSGQACGHRAVRERPRRRARHESDRPSVSDDVWDMAAEQFDEAALVALALHVALINTWNRLNVITGQVAGAWTAQYGA